MAKYGQNDQFFDQKSLKEEAKFGQIGDGSFGAIWAQNDPIRGILVPKWPILTFWSKIPEVGI